MLQMMAQAKYKMVQKDIRRILAGCWGRQDGSKRGQDMLQRVQDGLERVFFHKVGVLIFRRIGFKMTPRGSIKKVGVFKFL